MQYKLLCLCLFNLLMLATPAWANNPPGMQMLVAELFIMPLVVLLTTIGGGYLLLPRRSFRWLWVVLGLFISMMHEGFSALIMLLFSAFALGRGLQLIVWGFQARRSASAEKFKAVQPLRLIFSGLTLAFLAVLLCSINWVFLNFYHSDDLIESQFREVVQKQANHAKTHKNQAGQPLYLPMVWDEERRALRLGDDEQGYFQRHISSARFKARFEQAQDLTGFKLWVYPEFMPPFPYNYLSSLPSFYADQRGELRMIRTVWAQTPCPEDAPIFGRISAEKGTEK